MRKNATNILLKKMFFFYKQSTQSIEEYYF